jgi:hypothetical protein
MIFQVVLNGPEPKPFTFDYAAGSNVSQLEMFELIGKPFAESCLAGYGFEFLCRPPRLVIRSHVMHVLSIDITDQFLPTVRRVVVRRTPCKAQRWKLRTPAASTAD